MLGWLENGRLMQERVGSTLAKLRCHSANRAKKQKMLMSQQHHWVFFRDIRDISLAVRFFSGVPMKKGPGVKCPKKAPDLFSSAISKIVKPTIASAVFGEKSAEKLGKNRG